MKQIIELLVVMAIVINQIQFLLFSLAGIKYDPESGTGLVAILNVAFFAICMVWVIFQEMTTVSYRWVTWPYVLIAIVLIIFLIESVVFPNLTMGSFAGKQLLFFGTGAVPAICLATYIYKYDRFDMVTRSMDLIMLICTLALTLNLPNMLSGVGTIGGSGGHQELSYNAAFCFAINLTNLMSGNTENRLTIFTTKFFRYIFIAMLPLQAIICILGGGRGGGVLLVFSFVAVLYVYSYKNFVKTMFLGLLTLIAFVVIVSNTDLFADGFGRTFNYLEGGKFSLENDMSDMERTGLREQSYIIIAESPIIGYGLWNGLVVAGYYMHNVFLDVLISGGFLYLFLFLLFMKRVFGSIWNILIERNDMCMILPLVLLPTTMLMFSGYYLTSPLFWFCTIFALLWRNRLY